MTKTPTNAELEGRLWKAIDHERTVMLGLVGADHMQPMTAFADEHDRVRDWLEQAKVDGKPWSKTPPAPRVPDAVIARTAAKYQEALDRLTA